MKTIIFVLSFFFYYLLNELNAGLQVETEIDEGPLDTFTSVLFLLENKHVVIEELLQLLVDKVNPQLLEGVELKNIIFRSP